MSSVQGHADETLNPDHTRAKQCSDYFQKYSSSDFLIYELHPWESGFRNLECNVLDRLHDTLLLIVGLGQVEPKKLLLVDSNLILGRSCNSSENLIPPWCPLVSNGVVNHLLCLQKKPSGSWVLGRRRWVSATGSAEPKCFSESILSRVVHVHFCHTEEYLGVAKP